MMLLLFHHDQTTHDSAPDKGNARCGDRHPQRSVGQSRRRLSLAFRKGARSGGSRRRQRGRVDTPDGQAGIGAGEQPSARVVIGIGRPGVGPGNWRQSQQQARESWRLGREWQTAPVTYFGDLGLYQLLTALGDNHEATRFFRKTLGRLIEHDQQHNAELVETLDAFFVCHGNLSQTASRLHIHRNTLTYRLDRIAAITALDLSDADARFSLQLALKLRPVMRSMV